MDAVLKAARQEAEGSRWNRPTAGPGARSRSADPRTLPELPDAPPPRPPRPRPRAPGRCVTDIDLDAAAAAAQDVAAAVPAQPRRLLRPRPPSHKRAASSGSEAETARTGSDSEDAEAELARVDAALESKCRDLARISAEEKTLRRKLDESLQSAQELLGDMEILEQRIADAEGKAGSKAAGSSTADVLTLDGSPGPLETLVKNWEDSATAVFAEAEPPSPLPRAAPNGSSPTADDDGGSSPTADDDSDARSKAALMALGLAPTLT